MEALNVRRCTVERRKRKGLAKWLTEPCGEKLLPLGRKPGGSTAMLCPLCDGPPGKRALRIKLGEEKEYE